jgi:hypothetical protein
LHSLFPPITQPQAQPNLPELDLAASYRGHADDASERPLPTLWPIPASSRGANSTVLAYFGAKKIEVLVLQVSDQLLIAAFWVLSPCGYSDPSYLVDRPRQAVHGIDHYRNQAMSLDFV